MDPRGAQRAFVFFWSAFLWIGAELTAQCEAPERGASPSPAADENFGAVVAIDGTTAVVGAQRADDAVAGSSAGEAWVFELEDGSWSPVARLAPSDPKANDEFGSSVAVSGDTIVVGAFRADPAGQTGAGAAYVFVRPPGGWADMTETAKLVASDAGGSDRFGDAVATDGDTIAVAAPFVDTTVSDIGAVYVFCRDRAGTADPLDDAWTQRAILVPSGGETSERLGSGPRSLAISGDVLVASTEFGNAAAGSVRVFVRTTAGTSDACDDAWSERVEIVGAIAGELFGRAVALSPDYLAVGAPGRGGTGGVYLYARNRGALPDDPHDDSWASAQVLVDPFGLANDALGTSIAFDTIGGQRLVAGAPGDDANGSGAGTVHTFTRNASGYVHDGEVVAPPVAAGDLYGTSVALSDTTLAVGAPLDDDGGSNSGSVWFFHCPPPNEPPVALCSDLVLAASGVDCSATLAPEDVDGGSFDPDGGVLIYAVDPPGPFPLGIHAVTLTVTDEFGASASCTSVVTVEDRAAPEILCPENITVACTGVGGAPVDFVVTATDSCDAAPEITCTTSEGVEVSSGDLFPSGDTIVTCTATDSAGNDASCEFTISVIADELSIGAIVLPPTVFVGEDAVFGVTHGPSAHQIVWSFGDGESTGPLPIAAGNSVVHRYAASGVYFGTATVTSLCGQTATAAVTVVVEDSGFEAVAGAGKLKKDDETRSRGEFLIGVLRRPRTGEALGLLKVSHPDLGSLCMTDTSWLVVTANREIFLSGKATIDRQGAFTFILGTREGGAGIELDLEVWEGDVDPFQTPNPPVEVLHAIVTRGAIRTTERAPRRMRRRRR